MYESSGWDGGIGFDYVYIKYCPICGRKLDKYDRFNRNKTTSYNEGLTGNSKAGRVDVDETNPDNGV